MDLWLENQPKVGEKYSKPGAPKGENLWPSNGTTPNAPTGMLTESVAARKATMMSCQDCRRPEVLLPATR